jgi:hypothetical protein
MAAAFCVSHVILNVFTGTGGVESEELEHKTRYRLEAGSPLNAQPTRPCFAIAGTDAARRNHTHV